MTTFSGQVATGNDDAHEADDGSGFNASAVTMRCEASTTASSRWNCAFRIDNVSVPPGAIITNAYASVVFPVAQRDSPDLDWYLNDVDDAADFATETDVTSRAKTSSPIAWNDSDLGSGSFVDGPDISALVQAVVDRGGWAQNNAMVVIAEGQNATAQEDGCRFTPYDNVTADACKLTIEYEMGRGPRILKPEVGYVPIHQLQL